MGTAIPSVQKRRTTEIIVKETAFVNTFFRFLCALNDTKNKIQPAKTANFFKRSLQTL